MESGIGMNDRVYNGPLTGALPDGWMWWVGTWAPGVGSRQDLNAIDASALPVWIKEDGTEHHVNEAPPAARRALRRRWCEMWGWTVSPARYDIDGRPAVRAALADGGGWYYTRHSLDSASQPGGVPAPVRGLVADMLGEGSPR